MADKVTTVVLDIEGMDCSSCALTITKSLEKKGLANVHVNFATGEASFALAQSEDLPAIIKGINSIGYRVIGQKDKHPAKGGLSFIEKKFYATLPFTVLLFFSHMFFPHDFFLNGPWVQLGLCFPVFIIGLFHFGRSAIGSLKAGAPNMDVLIAIGSSAAFIYSLTGTILFYGEHHVHDYLFYETAAMIITLVLFGNLLEHRSVKQTTTSIAELSRLQVSTAKKAENHNGHEHIVSVNTDQVKVNDILLVNNGDHIPLDGVITSGFVSVNQAMITGESLPVEKTIGDKVTGGTIVVNGNMRMQVESIATETVLAKIINMVKNAQQSKPAIQKLGDMVSGVFVPVVLLISLTTFLISWLLVDLPLSNSLMNSVAVLVISCPCAMGLATPTAVMVGIGRAARNGILIKGGSTLEEFAKIKNIVFDKTGTLTTGEFKISAIACVDDVEESEIRTLLFHIEQHSSHPIARSIVKELQDTVAPMELTNIKEEKGAGLHATAINGDRWSVGSHRILNNLTTGKNHSVYIVKNDKLVATVNLEDSLKSNVKETIAELKSLGLRTIMVSGDNKEKCEKMATMLGIDKVYSEQLPSQKLKLVEEFVKEGPTAMVGDGINDAPALARATVGISLGDATQVAIESAQIVLLKKNDLQQLTLALRISKHTLLTIKQNLFWAFFYNVVAIPFAAAGFLSPMIGALSMAFSDVIVIGNSIRLKKKKI